MGACSDQGPEPELQEPKRHIKQPRREERQLKADISRLLCNRTHEPDLVHARYDERHRKQTRPQRGEACREAAGVVPVLQVVRAEVAATDHQVLAEDNRPKCARPISDEPEEVCQGIVKLVRADDGERNDAG